MKESEGQTLPEMMEQLEKAITFLVVKGRTTQQIIDLVRPVIDHTYNTVKDHECEASAAVFASVARSAMEISAALSAFNDHIEVSHGIKPEAKTEAVVERKENVIYLDPGRGKKPN